MSGGSERKRARGDAAPGGQRIHLWANGPLLADQRHAVKEYIQDEFAGSSRRFILGLDGQLHVEGIKNLHRRRQFRATLFAERTIEAFS